MNDWGGHSIQLGLERCVEDPPSELVQAQRFGLLANRASVNRDLREASELLNSAFPQRLVALFTPQHGWWGEQQANMIETPHTRHARLDVPIWSLYSDSRRPQPQMLEGLDCLVVDLQDVGTRVYTFIWTVLECLRACAEVALPVVILDRPNPLGGVLIEGPLLDAGFRSFVGMAEIPMRHGLTIGELARWLAGRENLPQPTVVPLQGWRREWWFGDLARCWIGPSPNLPTARSALVYPGQVLLEGTNLSEGRGTTTPFEVIGAPWVDPEVLIDELRRYALPGVSLLPLRFVPSFDKWAGQSCGGISLHVTDREAFRPYRTSVAVLGGVQRLWPNDLQWLDPPYEYENHQWPIDIISGSDRLRLGLPQAALNDAEFETLVAIDAAKWREVTADARLYKTR